MVPQEVEKVKKWTENGFKNTKSHFFQYMKALKHLNLAKWFITLRWVRYCRKFIFPLKLGVYGPTRGPKGPKMDRKWGQKHKIALLLNI